MEKLTGFGLKLILMKSRGWRKPATSQNIYSCQKVTEIQSILITRYSKVSKKSLTVQSSLSALFYHYRVILLSIVVQSIYYVI